MKLLQLLAKELREWPSGTKCMAQNSDASAVMLKSLDVVYRNEIWVGADGVSIVGFRNLSELATDHATAIVTRADWEAAKDKLEGKGAATGFIRHRGGKCPVKPGTKVDYRMRTDKPGVFATADDGAKLRWSHGMMPGDIMAYRIHNPAEQLAIEPAVVENVQAFNAQAELLYDPVAQGPLQWRNRIYKLDTQRAELEATYQRQIGEIDGERVELVRRLASEGLALVEVLHPVEDMSYPHNWKQGDVLLCEDSESGHYTTGKLYKFICISPSGSARSIDDRGRENGLMPKFFKWHSRPGK